MQHHNPGSSSRFILITTILAVLQAGVGCASRVYRAASLPPELCVAPTVDIESINLSGLTDRSVSVDMVQPGDVLDISMVTDYAKLTTTTTAARVTDDGLVLVPLVGAVRIGGMDVEQAERTINSESVTRGLFRNPCITVTMKQCRTYKVTVTGAVKKPGTYDLHRGSTSLMAALVAAEGLSEEASTDVEIRHTDSRQLATGGPRLPQFAEGQDVSVSPASYQPELPAVAAPTVTKVDLAAATSGGVKTPELGEGDVVHVMKRTLRPIHVIGLVCRPGEFPYPANKEIRVLDALALAGGISNPVAEEVLVLRQAPGEVEPVRIAVSIQAAKNGRDNLPLAPGDTVTVEQTAATAVVGVIQTFVRFGIGTSISMF